jgi:hypothetical protein
MTPRHFLVVLYLYMEDINIFSLVSPFQLSITGLVPYQTCGYVPAEIYVLHNIRVKPYVLSVSAAWSTFSYLMFLLLPSALNDKYGNHGLRVSFSLSSLPGYR